MKPVVTMIFVSVIACASPGAAQSASATSDNVTTPRPFDPGQNTTNPSSFAVQAQNPFLGSVPTGKLVPGVMSLSLRDAVALALRTNLGYVDASQEHEQSRAARLRAISRLLPQVGVNATEEYRNLISDTLGVPKLGLPHAIAAFNYQTAHATYQQNLLDIPAMFEVKAASLEVTASHATTSDARNIVVLASASSYLLVAASQTRLQTATAQLDTATTARDLLASRVRNDLAPEIDQIRATVAMRSAALRVKLAATTLAKDKLALTRIIGLPIEQQFSLPDELQYQPLPLPALDEQLAKAAISREDTKAAKSRLESAEAKLESARAERLPAVEVRANAGETGITFGHPYRDYEVEGRISIPIFTGRRIEADVLTADATFERRKAEYADATARVAYEVRTALLDLDAAQTSVEVATENSALAAEGMRQATDRFEIGLSNVVDLMQAQQALAEAQDNQVASAYAHQLAKLLLVRATGTAEQDYTSYLGVR